MKPLTRMIAVAVIASGGAVVAAAQTGAGPVDAQAGAQATAQSSVQSREISDRYMTSVQTELTGKVDTKNATVGQEVTARTKQSAKLADGTTLPKGTKLVGHVTQVQPQMKSEGRSGSLLAMTFDHAELKGGQTLQLRSVMQAVAPPASMASSADMQMDTPMAPVGGGATASAGARGGLGGGALGGTVRGAGQTVGGVGQAAGSAVGTTTRDTEDTLGSATRTAGGAVVSAGENVSGVARATALPGVMLSTAATANGSGTLTAAGRNITLESGTQITLGVIAQ